MKKELKDKHFYWVKLYKSADWQVGKYFGSRQTFGLTNGGAKSVNEVYEYDPTPIARPSYTEEQIRVAAKYTAIGQGLLDDLFGVLDEIQNDKRHES